MRTSLLTLALLATPLVAHAQQTKPSFKSSTEETTALTVGYLNVDFDMATPDGEFVYSFSGPTKAVMISSEVAQFGVGYGTSAADSASGDPSIRLVDAVLSSGGNLYLLRGTKTLPVTAYVPMRLDLGHRYVSTFGDEDAGAPERDPLHLSRAAVSAGAGGSVRLPTALPILRDNVVGFGTLTFGIGATGNMQGGLQAVHLLRTRELHLQIKVERLLNNIGATVGYVHRNQKWDQETVSNASEVLERIDTEPEKSLSSTQHMFYVGINF